MEVNVEEKHFMK